MYLTNTKDITTTQAIATTASKGYQVSYPKLQTPYNEANPPKGILFHWFGGETKGEGVPVEQPVKLPQRVRKADLLPLAEEIGVDISEHKRVNQCLEAFAEIGYYLVVDLIKN